MKHRGPVCRWCRREGEKLWLKGVRCTTVKCPFEKEQARVSPPGQQSWQRKPSEYGMRLREKQKVKRVYGLVEKPFRRLFAEAERQRGNTGNNLIVLLERRLDNVVYRAGFGCSRRHARQLIGHGHIRVNDRKVTIPSFRVGIGDMVTLKDREASRGAVEIALAERHAQRITAPSWLSVTEKPSRAEMTQLPSVEEASHTFNINLVVELTSR